MISKYSVKRPYTVFVGVVLIIILGVVSFTSMQTDLLPDMTLPYAIVYTTYPGASPEEVETIVTRPVEQSMATISNIENISSVSAENISTVILEFSQSANMDAVTIEMRENLDQIEGYWDDTIGSPIIMKLNPDMLPVMVAAIEAGDMTQSELTALVNNDIQPELESIEGVAAVSGSGTIEEHVEVTIREDKLKLANRKVRNALDQKFEEAESELHEAESELEAGEEELNAGQEELINQTSQADSQLTSGNTQMITGTIQIDQKLAEAESGLQKLDASEKELLSQEKQLAEGEEALNQLPAQLQALTEQQTQIQQGISTLETAPQMIARLNAGISALENGTDGTPGIGTLTAQIEAMKALIATGGAATGGTSDAGSVGEDADSGSFVEGGSIDIGDLTGGTTGGTTENSDSAEPGMDEGYIDEIILEENAGVPTQASPEENAVIPAQVSLETHLAVPTRSAMEYGTDPAAALAAMESALAQLTAQKAELENQKAQLLAGLSALGVDTSKEGEQLNASIDTAKSQLISRKIQIDDGITTIQKNIDEMPDQLKKIKEGKAAVKDGKKQITEGREQLQQAKAQLEAAKAEILAGQSSVSDAAAELNAAKISATIEMAAGKAELSSGKKQIEAALEQIKEQKEAAYDQADVTAIITAEMVKGILAAQNFSMPAGYVTEEGIDFLVRVGNKLEDTEALEDLVLLDLHMEGLEPIRLSDVADVVIIDNSDEVYAKINGHAGVMFSMQKQSGYSTGDVSDKIKARFAQLEAKDERIHFVQLMDQGIYIDMVVNSVIENMLSGAVLAILILLVFLRSFRTTLVIACSIPISILAAIVMMYFSKISLNIISLSGLALGIGMLVDNSIVVIENIFRLRNEGYSARKAAVEGANQVAGSIAASTLTTVCVFLPIVFTKGITRQLFVDMGLTIGYSLLASLVVALTLVPAMGAGLLKKTKEKKSRLSEAFQNAYAVLLRFSLKIKFLVLLAALGLLVYSGYLAISKGTAFMPEMESTQVTITISMPKDSLLSETAAMSDEVAERIMTIQDVTDVGVMAGGSGVMNMMGGGSSQSSADSVTMYVLLSEKKTISNEDLVKEIQAKTSELTCELDIQTSTMDLTALGGSGLSIKIKGRDLDLLKKMAVEVAAMVESVEGTENVSDGIAEKTLEQRLVVNKNKAMSYQLTTAQIYQFLQQKLAEAKSATTLSTISRDYSVLVVSDSDETLTREKIKKLKITGKDKDQKDVEVPLSKLVEFVDTEGFSSISRESQSRYVTVSSEIDSTHNIGLVAAEVQKLLDQYEVPEGYSIDMAGEDETINDALLQVGKMLALAVAFMYLIMVAQFQSLLSPFIIMFTIPLAFTGGLFGLYLTDNPVSVIAMIGFVMLSGIIVNNGIVLVDYINQLRRAGMVKKEAIVEAGRTRLRPILMTALTTILGLFSMAMGNGMGADMVQPMAIVTIGGLTYGTLLTLFVVPCIYDIFNRNRSMVEEEL